MKKFMTAVLAIFLLTAFGANAQDVSKMTPEQRATKATGWMKTNLKLSDDQTNTVQQINLKYANKHEELKTSTKTKSEKMEYLKADEKAKDTELKSVLTDDQFKTYQAKKDELKAMLKEKKNM